MKNDSERTPAEKARRNTFGAIARLGACAYLAYIIYKLIRMSASGESGMPTPVVIAITAVLGIAAVFLIAVTVRNFLTGVKNQEFSMHKYYQDELTAKGLTQNEFGEFVPIESIEQQDSETEEEPAEDEQSEDETNTEEE